VLDQLCRLLAARFPTDKTCGQCPPPAGGAVKTKTGGGASAQSSPGLNLALAPPTDKEEALLRQLVLGSSLDCVAKLCPVGTVTRGSALDKYGVET